MEVNTDIIEEKSRVDGKVEKSSRGEGEGEFAVAWKARQQVWRVTGRQPNNNAARGQHRAITGKNQSTGRAVMAVEITMAATAAAAGAYSEVKLPPVILPFTQVTTP